MPPTPDNLIGNDVPASRAPDPATPQCLAKAWAHQRSGDLTSAEALGMQMIQADSTNAEAWTLLGTISWQMGSAPSALDRFQRALALAPEVATHHTYCGIVLQALGRHEESEVAFRESVRLDPDRAEAHYNLATALRELRRSGEAEEHLRQAIRLRPEFVQAHNNLGACLQELGRFAEAEACFRQALQVQPGLREVHYNLALLLLLTGDFANGWQEYELRGQLEALAVQRFDPPVWDGSALAGRRILLQCEQGLGDTLQFVRYARHVHERGARVMLHCPQRLLSVLRSCAGIDELIPLNLAPPPFDVRVPLMSLPHLLGTRLESIPATMPYLSAGASLTIQWRKLLTGSECKVGIAWQGNPKHPRDRERSVPLSLFAPLAGVPGVQLISLQVGPGQEQIEANGGRWRVLDLGRRLDPAGFHDVAAVMQCLDVVITVDSALAHLAGALGVRTWIALPFVPDWRWLLGREDSPWYPSVRLFRQLRIGEWESVFARMADALTAHVRDRSADRRVERSVVVAPQSRHRPDARHQAMLVRAWDFLRAGEMARAEDLALQVARADPHYGESWNLLGTLAMQTGRAAEAVDHFGRALALAPKVAAQHTYCGIALQAVGRHAECETAFREALRLDPDNEQAHYNLGTALRDLDRYGEAEICYRQALQLQPKYPKALNNLGATLREQKRYEEAEACYLRGLELEPDLPEIHNNLGEVLRDTKRFSEAEVYFRRALELKPDFAEAFSGLGSILGELGRQEERIACLRRALELRPDYADAHINIAGALSEAGHVAESTVHYERAIELKPEKAETHTNLGFTLSLRAGDYARGWPEYEWRLRLKDSRLDFFPQPFWDGSPLNGQAILLQAEQGLGDLIQFIRYAVQVKNLGGRVVFHCPPKLLSVLGTCPGIDRIVPQNMAPPPVEVRAPLLSLPRLLGTTVATIPAVVPYVCADVVQVDQWRRDLAGLSGFKIGIVWQGNPKFGDDHRRSVSLERFEVLAGIPGVHLISLQVGTGREQIAALEGRFPVHDAAQRFDPRSFGDVAAVLKCVDLVITVDTAIAHLAGAMGVATWILLANPPDWRWRLPPGSKARPAGCYTMCYT